MNVKRRKKKDRWISRWYKKLKKSKTDRANEQIVKILEEEKFAEAMDDLTPDLDL